MDTVVLVEFQKGCWRPTPNRAAYIRMHPMTEARQTSVQQTSNGVVAWFSAHLMFRVCKSYAKRIQPTHNSPDSLFNTLP